MKTTKTNLKNAYDTFMWTLRDVTGGTTEENLRGADYAVTRLEIHASEISRLLENPNAHCKADAWLMDRCGEIPARLETYRERYVGKYEAWKAEQEAKRKAADNVIPFRFA